MLHQSLFLIVLRLCISFCTFQLCVFIKKMGFEAMAWYCKPVAQGFWEKTVDGAFGAYTPCVINTLVMLVSQIVLLGLCLYRIWIIFCNAKAQLYVLRNKYYNCVLGILACYCAAEPVLRLVMRISLFSMDEEIYLPPFEVTEIKLICLPPFLL